MSWDWRLRVKQRKLISPSDADPLEAGLDYIGETVTTANQFCLFRLRAEKIYNNVRAHNERRRRILQVVKELREQVHQTHSQKGVKPNVGDHEQYRKLLQNATTKLNAEMTRGESQIAADMATEKKAIQQDKLIRDTIARAPATLALHAANTIKRDIYLYKMEAPGTLLEIISRFVASQFKICQDLRFYISRRFVPRPEVWIRLKKKHDLTKEGYKWMYLEGYETVTFEPSPGPVRLDIVDRDQLNASKNYIVALVEEGYYGPEFPFVLVLPDVGEPCCAPPCGNLRNHLENIWKRSEVIKATRFSRPTDMTVLATDLVGVPFKTRTNDLQLTRVLAQPPP